MARVSSNKKQNIIKRWWGIPWGKFALSFGVTLIAEFLAVIFVLYGPIAFIRNMLITSAMTTLNHQYYATTFYSDERIQAVLDGNKVVALKTQTNPSAITVQGGEGVTFRKIKGLGYKGYILDVEDPSWVHLGIPENFGHAGEKLPALVEAYNALGGINAGGFLEGSRGQANGLVVIDGEMLQRPDKGDANVVGFNQDGVLILGKYKEGQIEALKLQDACEFKPFLIINGEPAEIRGNGGWGIAPRTAIGQRKDGSVVLVVIDGRSLHSLGATMKQLQQILIDEGVYNAANLDGGTSSVMHYKGKVVSRPSGDEPDGMRELPNAWLVMDPKDYMAPEGR